MGAGVVVDHLFAAEFRQTIKAGRKSGMVLIDRQVLRMERRIHLITASENEAGNKTRMRDSQVQQVERGTKIVLQKHGVVLTLTEEQHRSEMDDCVAPANQCIAEIGVAKIAFQSLNSRVLRLINSRVVGKKRTSHRCPFREERGRKIASDPSGRSSHQNLHLFLSECGLPNFKVRASIAEIAAIKVSM